MAEPIAWAVLCRSGRVHEPPLIGFGGASLYLEDPGEGERAAHDELNRCCGPHRAVPLYALTDDEAAALRDVGMRRDADLVRQDSEGE